MADIYVARTRLKVGDSYRLPGEEIPEAASWRNLHSYLASGAVRLVQRTAAEPPAKKVRVRRKSQE